MVDSTLMYVQPEHGQPVISDVSAGAGGIARSEMPLLAGSDAEAAPAVEAVLFRLWAFARRAARIRSSFGEAFSTDTLVASISG